VTATTQINDNCLFDLNDDIVHINDNLIKEQIKTLPKDNIRETDPRKRITAEKTPLTERTMNYHKKLNKIEDISLKKV